MVHTFWAPNYYGARQDRTPPPPLKGNGFGWGNTPKEPRGEASQDGYKHTNDPGSDHDSMDSNDHDNHSEDHDIIPPLHNPQPKINITPATPPPPPPPRRTTRPAHIPPPITPHASPSSPAEPSPPWSTTTTAKNRFRGHVWEKVEHFHRRVRCAFHAKRFEVWDWSWRCERCGREACNQCKKGLGKGRGECGGGLRRARTG